MLWVVINKEPPNSKTLIRPPIFQSIIEIAAKRKRAWNSSSRPHSPDDKKIVSLSFYNPPPSHSKHIQSLMYRHIVAIVAVARTHDKFIIHSFLLFIQRFSLEIFVFIFFPPQLRRWCIASPTDVPAAGQRSIAPYEIIRRKSIQDSLSPSPSRCWTYQRDCSSVP